jgi:hypothetical protein
MSETEDFKSDIYHKALSESIGVPPSSHATSSVPSSISGNVENPICISDSDGDEDFIPPTAKELAERRRLNGALAVKEEPKDNRVLNRAVKEEPKGNVLIPVKSILFYFILFFKIFNISEL